MQRCELIAARSPCRRRPCNATRASRNQASRTDRPSGPRPGGPPCSAPAIVVKRRAANGLVFSKSITAVPAHGVAGTVLTTCRSSARHATARSIDAGAHDLARVPPQSDAGSRTTCDVRESLGQGQQETPSTHGGLRFPGPRPRQRRPPAPYGRGLTYVLAFEPQCVVARRAGNSPGDKPQIFAQSELQFLDVAMEIACPIVTRHVSPPLLSHNGRGGKPVQPAGRPTCGTGLRRATFRVLPSSNRRPRVAVRSKRRPAAGTEGATPYNTLSRCELDDCASARVSAASATEHGAGAAARGGTGPEMSAAGEVERLSRQRHNWAGRAHDARP